MDQPVYGTEKDKINCPFYLKIGACRHGDRCSKIHHKPLVSQSILLKNMYQHPAAHMSIVDSESLEYDDEEIQKSVEDFYEDLVPELQKFGDIEEVHVCENLGEHLMGNVYIKYATEDGAVRCIQALNGRYYAGKPIFAEFSPVTSFREARCRQFDQSDCSRGGFCNFMHIRRLRKEFYNKLFPYKRASNPYVNRGSSPSRKRGNSKEREQEVKRTRSSRSPPPRREEKRVDDTRKEDYRREDRVDTRREEVRREDSRREEYKREDDRADARREDYRREDRVDTRREDNNRRDDYKRGDTRRDDRDSTSSRYREEYRRDERRDDSRREDIRREDNRRDDYRRDDRKDEYRRDERRDDTRREEYRRDDRREEYKRDDRRREDERQSATKETGPASREDDYSPTAAYDQ